MQLLLFRARFASVQRYPPFVALTVFSSLHHLNKKCQASSLAQQLRSQLQDHQSRNISTSSIISFMRCQYLQLTLTAEALDTKGFNIPLHNHQNDGQLGGLKTCAYPSINTPCLNMLYSSLPSFTLSISHSINYYVFQRRCLDNYSKLLETRCHLWRESGRGGGERYYWFPGEWSVGCCFCWLLQGHASRRGVS